MFSSDRGTLVGFFVKLGAGAAGLSEMCVHPGREALKVQGSFLSIL